MNKVRDVVFTIILGAIFWALMTYGEARVLEDRVVPTAGTKLPEWLEQFKQWSTGGIAGSTLTGLVWYGLGNWIFKFREWNKNFRPIWYVMLSVPIILTVINCWYTKPSNEGGFLAYVFYGVNNLLTFYLATILFSPPPVMYTPPGAEMARRYW